MNWRISAFSISLIFNESWSRELWIMNYEVWIMRYECGVKSWSWNILLLEKILHYATLRSEWQGSVFCSRLGIYIIGGIFLNRKDFFSWIAFLSELSENSLANWESYVLNILLYLSNNKVIVTDYKSATSVLSENSLANWESYVLIFLLCLSNNKVIVTDYKSATSG